MSNNDRKIETMRMRILETKKKLQNQYILLAQLIIEKYNKMRREDQPLLAIDEHGHGNGALEGSVILFTYHGDVFAIEELSISPDKRRQGMGSKILDVLEGLAKELGADYIEVPCREDKQTVSFCLKHGYQPGARSKKYVDEVMAFSDPTKRLGPDAEIIFYKYI